MDTTRPTFRAGSSKWRAMQKWGFWVDAFSATCNPDNLSLQMGPLEYLEAQMREPRKMAIFRAIQDEMRAAYAARVPKPEGGRGGRVQP